MRKLVCSLRGRKLAGNGSVRMISRQGEVFLIDIFLYVPGYSRMKHLRLTIDKEQKTFFACLHNAFVYTGGVPNEL